MHRFALLGSAAALILVMVCRLGSQQVSLHLLHETHRSSVCSMGDDSWATSIGTAYVPCMLSSASGPCADEKKAIPEAGGWATVWQPTADEGKPSQSATEEVKSGPAPTAPPDSAAVAAAAAPVPVDFDEDVEWEDLDGGEGDGADAAEDDDVMWEDTG